VLRFWDEHVAVFVVNATDRLSSRSKVFAEIATAMWTVTATDDEITAWLTEALPYTDSDGAIALAAGLNDRVIECMLELSATNLMPASTLPAELVVREIVELTEEQTTRLPSSAPSPAKRRPNALRMSPAHCGRCCATILTGHSPGGNTSDSCAA
jgi:hypothetical protein